MIDEKDPRTDQRRGVTDKHDSTSEPLVHEHVFDSTVDNPTDPPARKYCACGHWEAINPKVGPQV